MFWLDKPDDMSYPLTTSLQVIKELQWVKEVTRGTTPTSPTFAAIPTKEFSPKISSDNIKYRKLGSPDLYKGILVRNMYDFGTTYAPVDGILLKYMVNLGATPSREDSFTFFLSQKQNVTGTLTEQYQIATGAVIDNVAISVATGELVTIDAKWIANGISTWATTSGFTGPTFAPTLSAVPWTSVNAGPFNFNSQAYDVRNFKCTINQNPDRVFVVGQNQTTWVIPTIREIAIDVDIVYKDTTVQADVKTLTARAADFTLNSTAPTKLNFTDMYLEAYDETVSADDTKAKTVSYSGFAASVALTP